MFASFRQFGIFFDRYYWQTALLIARNGLARLYRNSFLGTFWTLFQPFTLVLVYATILPLIMKSVSENYRLYILVSLPFWQFFNSCLVGASSSILANAETLKRCMVSSTVFPVADVIRNCYTLLISFCTMYTAALLLFSSFDPIVLLLPLYFLPVLIIIFASSVAIAFIAPYIRDIGELMMVAMSILFWLTPVIYQVDALPAQAQLYMHWNPFYIMLHPIQQLAFAHVLPTTYDAMHLFYLTILTVLVTFAIFRVCRRNYVYYL